jgi:hypothetical protein
MQPWGMNQVGSIAAPWLEWQGSGGSARRPLDRPLGIGRDPLNDICLPELSVSRRHAVVSLVGGQVVVDASSSQNGIVLGDSRVPRATVVAGQPFVIGETTFRVVAGPTAQPGATPGLSPAAPLSASIGPIVAGPQELIVAAGCAAGALIATVLPWYSTVLGSASVSGLQFVVPVIAPVVALIAYWKLHANPPESLTSGRIYALRISLAAGLVIAAWLLIAVGSSTTTTSYGYTYNTSSMVQPSVGIWLYGLACAVGAAFSFKIPHTKGVAK